jgi:hypothetical protein
MVMTVATGQAQAVAAIRTFVSVSGSDANICSRTAPCLTFAHAVTVTSPGGEIDCLSGGDFGPVVIATPLTIDCGGGAGGIGGDGSANLINITATSGSIVLRNLAINSFGSASYGILASAFNGTLTVQHCAIFGGFAGAGIRFAPNNGRGSLQVSDSAVNDSAIGILVNPPAGVIASVVLNRVELNNNVFGLDFEGAGIVAGTLRQSVVALSSQTGIVASSGGGVYFTVEGSSIVDNLSAGIASNAAAVNLEVGGSTIGGNGTGVTGTAGAILTFGNNQFSANGTNGTFTPGGPPLK